MITVREIHDPAEMAALAAAWSRVWSGTPGATFFQTAEWLETYWRHYGAGQRLKLLVVEQEGRPAGMMPLVVRSETSWLGPVQVLTYPLDFWGSFYAPLGHDAATVLRAAADHLARQARDWDVLDLRWIDADGPDRGQTAATFRDLGWHCQSVPHALVPLVDLSAGWQAYWSSRKSRFRGEVTRAGRRLAERGQVEFVRYRPLGQAAGECDPRWDLYEACVEVARQSHHAAGDHGVGLNHPQGGPLLRELHARAVELGQADVCLLMLDNRPVAFNYNYVTGGYVCGLRRAYDPACSEGAGSVIMRRMLEDSAARGDHTVDLGPDYLSTKRYWQSTARPSYRVLYYPRTNPRAQALHLGRWIRQQLARPTSAVTRP